MVILTRDDRGEHIPGLAERVVNHAVRYGNTNKLDASTDLLKSATWEQVYQCSPVSDLINHKPTLDDNTMLYQWTKEMDRRLDTRTMNEWARNLSDLMAEKPEKTVPFWRR